LLDSRPTPKLKDHPFIGCPRLLIQYIRSYPPHLEAVSFIRDRRMRHAGVTRTQHSISHPNKYRFSLTETDLDQYSNKPQSENIITT